MHAASHHETAVLVAIAVIFALLTWPGTQLAPQAGLDQSWQAGLAMAFEKNIQWGPRIDFTYGPLGFLVVPMLYYHLTAALSLVYLAASRWLLYLLLLRECRRKLSWPGALAMSFVIGATAIAFVDGADLLMALAILIYADWQQHDIRAERTKILGHVALPAFAGLGLLVKFSVGILAVFLVILVVVQTARWQRATLTSAASFFASLLLLWVATGNSLANIFQYLRASVSIAGGYSAAMSLEVGRTDEWFYALVLLATLALLLRWAQAAKEPRRSWATWLAYAGFGWIALKEGFVRHDGHDLEFFGLMCVALASVPWRRPTTAGRLVPAVGVACILTWSAAGSVPSNLVSLATGVHSFQGEAIAALGPSGTEIMHQAQGTLASGYGLPASMLAQMAGHTVAIEPYENTVAWAYPEVRWDPEPVLQQYSAYTTPLDNLNADFLRSGSAPDFILNQPVVTYEGIDQNPYFESPTADMQMLCHYREVTETPQWQLLRHTADRCGALERLATVRAQFGTTVRVPTAPSGYAVFASFRGVGSALLYRAENLVLKARAIQMLVPGSSYRFVAATGSGLHVLTAPPSLRYAPVFRPPAITMFTLFERNLFSDGGRYRVTFYKVRVSP